MEVLVPAEPEPIKLDTERTALIVVDMQNSFCKKGGMLDALGRLDELRAKRVIATVKKAIVGIVILLGSFKKGIIRPNKGRKKDKNKQVRPRLNFQFFLIFFKASACLL